MALAIFLGSEDGTDARSFSRLASAPLVARTWQRRECLLVKQTTKYAQDSGRNGACNQYRPNIDAPGTANEPNNDAANGQ
jgi:hypothetical protein